MLERLKKIVNPLKHVGNDPIEKSVSYGDFYERSWNETEDVYFIVPYTSGSDYSGDTVTRANYKFFEKEYEDVDCIHLAYGGYDTYAIIINATKLCDSEILEEITEILEGLADDPLIDEDLLTEVEMELIEDAWVCWVEYDFIKALEKKFSFADFNFPDIRDLFEEKREEAWVCEGHGHDMWINVKNVVDEIEFEDVKKWATVYTVTWNDIGEKKLYYYDRKIAERKVIELKGRGFHATIK